MPEKPELKRVLTLLDATMINTGGIIGSGIFIVPATVAFLSGSSILMFMVWILGGIVSLFGAISVAELGALYPKAGGQYVYLNHAYGPVWGYLYGWSAIAVINTASIAAVGVAFAEYLNFFYAMSVWNMKWIAVASIILLTLLNIVNVKAGARAQNFFTILKIAAILVIITLGLTLEGGSTANFQPIYSSHSFSELIGQLGLAMVAVLWTFDGWIFITYIAGEVENPGRNIPLSLVFCMIIVTLIYLLMNIVFTYTLGVNAMGDSKMVGSDSVAVFLGEYGAGLVTIIILLTLLGANNGFILSSARINYAMASDRLFFSSAAKIHPQFNSPANALIMQCIWATILTFTGTFNQLITYIIFASWIFYGMSAGAVIILRKKYPERHRPFRTPFYPWVPVIFILFAVLLTLNTIIEAPRDSAIGIIIILAGLPIYYWRKSTNQSDNQIKEYSL